MVVLDIDEEKLAALRDRLRTYKEMMASEVSLNGGQEKCQVLHSAVQLSTLKNTTNYSHLPILLFHLSLDSIVNDFLQNFLKNISFFKSSPVYLLFSSQPSPFIR